MRNVFYGSKLNKYENLQLFIQSSDDIGLVVNNKEYELVNKVVSELDNIEYFIYSTSRDTKKINIYILKDNNIYPIIKDGVNEKLIIKAKSLFNKIIDEMKNLIEVENEEFLNLYEIDNSDKKKQENRVRFDIDYLARIYTTIDFKTFLGVINKAIPYGILNDDIDINEIAFKFIESKDILESLFKIENNTSFKEYINNISELLLLWNGAYTEEMIVYKETLLKELNKEIVIINKKKFSEYEKYLNKKCVVHCDKMKRGFIKALNLNLKEPIMILENVRTIYEIELRDIKKISIIE